MKRRAQLIIASAMAITCGAAALLALVLSTVTDSATAGNVGAAADDPREFPATKAIGGHKVKDLKATRYKQYARGAKIRIKCQAWGTLAYESYIWDKTTDGFWVPDHYVKTGHSKFVPGVPKCDDDKPTAGPGHGKPVFEDPRCAEAGAVHGRQGKAAASSVKGSAEGTSEQKIERVVAAALSQTGKNLPYSWGGGGLGGPSCGNPKGHFRESADDYNRYGYDCSGLTAYAFWKGAGKDIGPATGFQITKGEKVSYKELRRGDLIFWGGGSYGWKTTHVALYLGKDKIVEAQWPRTTTSVRVRDFDRSAEKNLAAHAIRVFT
ncbi:C40 family peptidase [Spirillospora sp. NPDC048911]|uniref:C40 family peptidase n=1 Tax=Spirillospora sp. NPDC048911 TaxID=3364527 RepID=UPI00371C3510